MNPSTHTPDAGRAIVQLPFDQLHDSPFNPPERATLAIDELAASIRAEGRVHQPLLVRPAPAGGCEIVFGHRRRYAAQAAGLASVPCEVREMSDAEVRSAQAAENVQRENLRALQEAEQYQAMMQLDGLSANDVAARIGKSRSHVYGRLRLLDLCPQVRQALYAGEVQSEVALLIARVGGEKMQAKALHAIRNIGGDIRDGGARSYRRIRELLNEKFTLQLDKAIFPIASAELLPSAGSCTTCGKRTGNAPEYDDITAELSSEQREQEEDRLQGELDKAIDAGDDARAEQLSSQLSGLHSSGYVRIRHTGGNVCTDPDCFEAKKRAHLKAEAARLQSEGATVITGGKARQAVNAQGELAADYVAADKVDLAKAKQPVQLVLIQNPRDGATVQAYRAEDLRAAGVKLKLPKARHAERHDPQAWERENKRKQQAAEAEAPARRGLLAAVRQHLAHDHFELRLIARYCIDQLEHADLQVLLELYQARSLDTLRQCIDHLSPDACARLMLDCVLVVNCGGDDHWSMQQQPEALLAAAAHYGVDIDAARRAGQPDAAAQTPAPESEVPTRPTGRNGKRPARAAAAEAQPA